MHAGVGHMRGHMYIYTRGGPPATYTYIYIYIYMHAGGANIYIISGFFDSMPLQCLWPVITGQECCGRYLLAGALEIALDCVGWVAHLHVLAHLAQPGLLSVAVGIPLAHACSAPIAAISPSMSWRHV